MNLRQQIAAAIACSNARTALDDPIGVGLYRLKETLETPAQFQKRCKEFAITELDRALSILRPE